ncbi:methylated-DNA--[protein]-cysteine S-methyltransferase [Wansuia hejianensis]|uniref:Methylated-DNA--protein-cysteine methyltransferase n=1 Tax=Wansuia hejianensis TaxID=2763667 RepID=A0A926EWI7_9FIRM|nr:methylated-DNA--[protein]-cysteine S-methyltransferase [Wansuia hejianensis]MBC8589628.1 methylated-DNA--[protein]-cysteine S-methyltransferase [Wansuia hejianensis]
MKNLFIYETMVGDIGIGDNGEAITDVFFGKAYNINDFTVRETELIKLAYEQIMDYFNGKSKRFNLPLYVEGTEFQKNVWKALMTIPYGETRSYKEIGELVGRPKAARAVGMANNKNPISIIIPCHRVIGSNGKLVGYGGGIKVKEELLNLEKKYY